ncbi:MAG: NADH-quinone oxidoreductase subunit L, partial [Candidatus Latescibacteria bacterium]|nr:NADH-quinone oxidoreductase subunit L [Candidatus Latescibacterota bacterium]
MGVSMISYSIAILLLPLAAFGIQIFFGKRLPRGGDWVSTGAIFIALLLALRVLGHAIGESNPNYLEREAWTWMDFGSSRLSLGIQIDNIAAIMLVVVTLVSALVHLYSTGYMHGDSRYHQFFAFLSLFSFSMLGLVLSDNFLCLYIFWELVGVSSYLLIGFWFEKRSAADACKKAFITNRVGDFGMFAGILILVWQVGPLGYQEVFHAVGQGHLSGGLLTLAGICLFLGAVGKSAQFPLHVWLPDAMEGPTPVSALIHAATMVAAGVYMVTRMFPILTPDALLFIAYIGAITAILGASIAIAQNDIKRVLAYSTISQLGYMVMGLGVGAYVAGFFHLVTHAAFKACLFLGSGSVIHAMHGVLHHSDKDPQDMRNMGALKKYMPTTYKTFLLATVALAGVPLTSGFLSKDSILAGTLEFSMEHPQHFLIPLIGFGAAGITAFYMFRLVFLTFHGEGRWKEGHGSHGHGHDSHGHDAHGHAGEPHESPRVMTIPLVVLASLSLWFWYSPNPVSPSGWFHHMIVKPESLATGGGHEGLAGGVEGAAGLVL